MQQLSVNSEGVFQVKLVSPAKELELILRLLESYWWVPLKGTTQSD